MAIRSWFWPVVLLGGGLIWSYASTILDLFKFWQQNEDYSAGMLIPPFVLVLVWRKRRELAEIPARPAWSGLGLLAVAEIARLFGLYFGSGSAERYALVLSIFGLVLLAAGSRIFRCLRWVLLVLVLMVPLPFRVHEAVAIPLQNAASTMTVFGLETAGMYVVREGNVLRVNDTTVVAVTEACSGLRMLTSFVVVAVVLASVVKGPKWRRAALVFLSVPIAVVSNGLRGFVTAYLMCHTGSVTLNQGIHDVAGWAMMPLALLLYLGALRLMNALFAASGSRTTSEPRRPRLNRPRRAKVRQRSGHSTPLVICPRQLQD